MSLETFFAPKSVAVVGVSDNPTKLGALVFKNLQDAGFKGKLYPVNPKSAGQDLYGETCYASVKDIKEPLDLVVLVVPAKFCSATVDDCIANGTKNISIITAGFAETGNKELELEIAKKCLDNGINLLGPNCLGHISTFDNLNASFADGFPAKGNVAFISQSGAYCSAMLDWAEKKGIGFSHNKLKKTTKVIEISPKENLGSRFVSKFSSLIRPISSVFIVILVSISSCVTYSVLKFDPVTSLKILSTSSL